MAVNDMLKKRQNGIRNNNKMLGGGEGGEDKNIYKNIYELCSYTLLFISYIFFGFATILLINAGVNYNKVDNSNKTAEDDGTPLIEQPIFEYLKRNNFMAIEEYLLAYNKPIFIIFIIAIGVCVIGIGIISYLKDNDVNVKQDFGKSTFRIALAIYGVMLGIFISFNVINSYKPYLPTDNLAQYHTTDIIPSDKLKALKGDTEYREFYKVLKYIIIDALKTQTNYEAAIKYIDDKLLGNDNVKIIDTANPLLFYKNIVFYYYKDYNGTPKENEYINHINNYFDLISNDKEPKKNEYINYYIYGLIKNKDDDSKKKLKQYLDNFKKNIYIYYILVFVFYSLFFLVVLVILGIDKPSMNFITIYKWDIGKVFIGFFLIYIPIWLTMLL